jgi:hypothetical protein
MWQLLGSLKGDHHPTKRLFFYVRKGYKLAFLKGRHYGQEEEKAALVDFKRSPGAEDNGAQENFGVTNCQEAEKDRGRHAPEGLQHRALARLPFLIFSSTSLFCTR